MLQLTTRWGAGSRGVVGWWLLHPIQRSAIQPRRHNMRDFETSVLLDCSAEAFWRLRMDLGFDHYCAAIDGQRFELLQQIEAVCAACPAPSPSSALAAAFSHERMQSVAHPALCMDPGGRGWA